jgi:hypothetical protein
MLIIKKYFLFVQLYKYKVQSTRYNKKKEKRREKDHLNRMSVGKSQNMYKLYTNGKYANMQINKCSTNTGRIHTTPFHSFIVIVIFFFYKKPFYHQNTCCTWIIIGTTTYIRLRTFFRSPFYLIAGGIPVGGA